MYTSTIHTFTKTDNMLYYIKLHFVGNKYTREREKNGIKKG